MQNQTTYKQTAGKRAKKLARLFPEVEKEEAGKNSNGTSEKTFIAVNSGKIVAHIKAEFSDEPFAHVAEMRSLVVLPEYRGQGIGIGLYRHAIKSLGRGIEIAIARVRTTNAASIRLHEKLGFKAIGRIDKGYKTRKEQADILIFSKEL